MVLSFQGLEICKYDFVFVFLQNTCPATDTVVWDAEARRKKLVDSRNSMYTLLLSQVSVSADASFSNTLQTRHNLTRVSD